MGNHFEDPENKVNKGLWKIWIGKALLLWIIYLANENHAKIYKR